MFIVKKKINGHEYYYLRESRREKGKVKAVTLAYLGKTKKDAEKRMKEFVLKVKKLDAEKDVMVEESNWKKTKIGIDELASYCKRKGFVYPSGDAYGGLAGFWDLGHLGVEVMRNLKDNWWNFNVRNREDMEGIDGSIITNPKVWEASGHVESFVDYIVVNKKSKEKFKVDAHEVEKYEKDDKYIVDGKFNPMFTTKVGPVNGQESYLRPETAQSIFTNFKSVFDNSRAKLPFGIAQIGKAFRNEIAPREFLFRAREFEQMEIEYFIQPGMKCDLIDEIQGIKINVLTEEMQKSEKESEEMEIYEAYKKGLIGDWQAYWLAQEYGWFIMNGADSDNFRTRQHTSDEKSHYAVDTWDLEYKFPMGWRELQGFANRGNFDLTEHQKASGKKFGVFVEGSGNVIPEVACEPSLGLGRAFLVFMLDAYEFDEKRMNVVLHLNPRIAPYKAAVMPLIGKGEVADVAYSIFKELKEEWNVLYDKSGSIGRRYSRNDEVGTPYCIAVDFESIKDKSVTIRDRDSTRQIRVKVDELPDVLKNLIKGKIVFQDAGKLVETRVK